jgi:pimeloyl-ACP methyl ester carboxylesterase
MTKPFYQRFPLRLPGLLAGLVLVPLLSYAQDRSAPDSLALAQMQPDLLGYWAGSLIRANSAQLIEADFRADSGALQVRWRLPQRVFLPWTSWQGVRRDSAGYLHARTYGGDVRLRLDTSYGQLVGTRGQTLPPTQLHLSRGVRPVQPEVRSDSFRVEAAGEQLAGTLYRPQDSGPHPCIVYVGGRGYKRRNYYARNKAKFFARHGIACAIYDERGTGQSTGAYAELTMGLRAREASAVLHYVQQQDDISAAGYLGSSAGGWVVVKATAEGPPKPAFITTVVGPATSVRKQQKDCARFYYKEKLEVPQKYLEETLRYVDLTFENAAGSQEATYQEMQQLLASGRETGWAEVLAPTDIPGSAAAVDSLWCRNFAYDPADDFAACTMPYLAFYGETDAVVPDETNAPLLRQRLRAAGNADFAVIVTPGVGHGVWQGGGPTTLAPAAGSAAAPVHYYRFTQVDARIYDRLLRFVAERFGSNS